MVEAAQLFNLEGNKDRIEVWHDINVLLAANARRVQNFEQQLSDANLNRSFEAQMPAQSTTGDVDLDAEIMGTWPEPGTLAAKSLSQEFKDNALYGRMENAINTEEELDIYRVAAKLNPRDVEAIKGEAYCYRVLGEYDRTFKKLIHLAVLAKENKDFELANFVLSSRLVDLDLLAAREDFELVTSAQNAIGSNVLQFRRDIP